MEGDGDKGGGGEPKPPKAGAEVFTREYVHELREENKTWRTKNSEAETARKAAEDKAAAAETASNERIKEANSAADKRVIRAELKAAAVKAGMIDLDALALADLSKCKLNDKGEVEGADELMEALQKGKPYLFADPSTSSTNKPPPKGETKPKMATEMTDEEYAAAKAKAIKR